MAPVTVGVNTAATPTLGEAGLTVKVDAGVLTTTLVDVAEEDPQKLLAMTETVPLEVAKFTVMAFVPCPEVIVVPDGADQL